MNCDQAQNLLIDFIYGETAPDVTKDLEKHLEACPDCASGYSRFEGTRRLTSNLPEPRPTQLTINRILAHARDEAQKQKPLWGLGWIKVLSAMCVVVIAGGLVLFQAESGLFRTVMDTRTPDSTAANTATATGGIKAAHESVPSTSLSTAAVPTKKIVKPSETSSPPAGIVKTGSSSFSHPHPPHRNTTHLKVSISIQNRDSTLTSAPPVPGANARKVIKTSGSAAGYRQVNKNDFSGDGFMNSSSSIGGNINHPENTFGLEPSKDEKTYQTAAVREIMSERTQGATASIKPRPQSRSVDLLSKSSNLSDANRRDLDINAILNAGRSALETGSITMGIHHLEHTLRLMPPQHPQRSQVLHDLAQAYQQNGDIEKARQTYRLIVSEYPNHREIVERKLHTLAAE